MINIRNNYYMIDQETTCCLCNVHRWKKYYIYEKPSWLVGDNNYIIDYHDFNNNKFIYWDKPKIKINNKYFFILNLKAEKYYHDNCVYLCDDCLEKIQIL